MTRSDQFKSRRDLKSVAMDHSAAPDGTDNGTSNGNGSRNGVDPRNSLNELPGPEWIQHTKSFFFQRGLGASHDHAAIEREHPAPFSFQDIQRLIAFFTKSNGAVLDPFGGVGSTAKACSLTGRRSVSIELSQRWHKLAKARLEQETEGPIDGCHEFICSDARKALLQFPNDSFDFVVTSPPYWSILNKRPDHKALERVKRDLATRYSQSAADLGNISDYDEFLGELVSVFGQCGRVLKPKRYMALIVSDFRHGNRLYAFHSDLIQSLQGSWVEPDHQLTLQGIKALLQNHKSLKPYGYPFAYVENIHHQYVLILQKQKRSAT